VYGYTGREPDLSTGLTYYRARYYDASLGRFISRDPMGMSAGINVYAYVDNNPTNFTDPSGMLAKSVTSALSGFGSSISNYFETPLVRDTYSTIKNGASMAVNNLRSDVYNGAMGWAEQFSHQPTGSFGRMDLPVTPLNPVASQVSSDLRGAAATAISLAPILAPSRTVSLYRAVDPVEFNSVMQTKTFAFGPNGSTMKQFGFSLDEVVNFANFSSDYAAVLKVDIPKAALKGMNVTKGQIDPFIFKSGVLTIEGPGAMRSFNDVVRSVEHAF